MPSYVNPEKCDGCKALDKTACQHICPNNLMVLDKATEKAWNREPEMCWECYNCVKICAQQAVDVRGYADFVPMGASVIPLKASRDIMWTVKFRDKKTVKRFKFPIRTTDEGTAVPNGGFETGGDINDHMLFTQPGSIGPENKLWTK